MHADTVMVGGLRSCATRSGQPASKEMRHRVLTRSNVFFSEVELEHHSLGEAHHGENEMTARQSLLEPSHAMRRGDGTELRHQLRCEMVEGEEGGLGSDVRTPNCPRLHLRGACNAATTVGYNKGFAHDTVSLPLLLFHGGSCLSACPMVAPVR